MNKKGILSELGGLIVPLVAIAIVLVVGFLIMAEAGDQIVKVQGTSGSFATCNSTACNATKTTQNAMADIPGWLPIIVITVIGALLIGLVTRFRASQ